MIILLVVGLFFEIGMVLYGSNRYVSYHIKPLEAGKELERW